MMNVSSWSIRNPIPAVMLFVLLTFAGLLSFNAMKVQNFPDIDLPTISVTASLPGAAPGQLENDVARKLENAVATLQGLKHIYTKVQDGVVTLTVEFRLEKPVQEAVDDVRSAVQRVRADLPADLRDPIVQKMDLAGQPVLAFTIRSPTKGSMDGRRSPELVRGQRRWRASCWPCGRGRGQPRGRRDARGAGGAGRAEAAGAGRNRRRHFAPAAPGADRKRRRAAPTWAAASSRCARWPPWAPHRKWPRWRSCCRAGAPSSWSDVATVSDTVAEPRAAALLNGKPVVGFEVARSRGESEVAVGAAIKGAGRAESPAPRRGADPGV
jgi:hypothetical protein